MSPVSSYLLPQEESETADASQRSPSAFNCLLRLSSQQAMRIASMADHDSPACGKCKVVVKGGKVVSLVSGDSTLMRFSSLKEGNTDVYGQMRQLAGQDKRGSCAYIGKIDQRLNVLGLDKEETPDLGALRKESQWYKVIKRAAAMDKIDLDALYEQFSAMDRSQIRQMVAATVHEGKIRDDVALKVGGSSDQVGFTKYLQGLGYRAENPFRMMTTGEAPERKMCCRTTSVRPDDRVRSPELPVLKELKTVSPRPASNSKGVRSPALKAVSPRQSPSLKALKSPTLKAVPHFRKLSGSRSPEQKVEPHFRKTPEHNKRSPGLKLERTHVRKISDSKSVKESQLHIVTHRESSAEPVQLRKISDSKTLKEPHSRKTSANQGKLLVEQARKISRSPERSNSPVSAVRDRSRSPTKSPQLRALPSLKAKSPQLRPIKRKKDEGRSGVRKKRRSDSDDSSTESADTRQLILKFQETYRQYYRLHRSLERHDPGDDVKEINKKVGNLIALQNRLQHWRDTLEKEAVVYIDADREAKSKRRGRRK